MFSLLFVLYIWSFGWVSSYHGASPENNASKTMFMLAFGPCSAARLVLGSPI